MDLDFPTHFSGQVMWYYVTMRPCSVAFFCASIYTLNQGFLVLSHATMVVPLPPQSVLWSCTYDAWQWIIWCFCLWPSRQAVEASSTSQHAVQSASIECTGFLRTDKLLLTVIPLIVISFHISLLPCSQFAVYTAFTGPVNPDRGQ